MAVGRDVLHVEVMVIKDFSLLVYRSKINPCQLSKIEIEI